MKSDLDLIYNLRLNYQDLQRLEGILNDLETEGKVFEEDLDFYREFKGMILEGSKKIESAIISG